MIHVAIVVEIQKMTILYSDQEAGYDKKMCETEYCLKFSWCLDEMTNITHLLSLRYLNSLGSFMDPKLILQGKESKSGYVSITETLFHGLIM